MQQPKTKLLAGLAKALQKAYAAHNAGVPASEASEYFDEQRRRFLQNTGKALIGVGLLPTLNACQKQVDMLSELDTGRKIRKKKNGSNIAIVGAGIAGLHAAWLLQQKGFYATVYEGSNRTGGRMYTAQNIMAPGLYTEMGGEFIDSIHHDMLQLVKAFNLELLDTRPEHKSSLQTQAFFFGGQHYTEDEVIEAFMPYVKLIKQDQLGMSRIITADSHTSFEAFLDNLSIADYFDRIGLQGWLRQLLDVAYVTEYGQPISQQTALNFLWLISPRVTDGRFEIFGASDERYKVAGGNQQIVDKLAEQLDGQVLLQHKLLSIHQQYNNSYQLTFDTPGGSQTINADYVLLTIPFTLLREVEVQPAWPSWKHQAIFDIGYGNNSKLMLGFTKRYWNDVGYVGYYFTDSFLQSGWDNSELQHPVAGGLTIYSGGQQALDVGNGTPMSQAAIHLPVLDAMYPGAQSHFNGNAQRFVWPTYPWTKCSYTCFAPGQYTTIAGNEIKPVGNILFAGEHCSYDYQGYMNGGAETGRRAAEEIMSRLNAPVAKS